MIWASGCGDGATEPDPPRPTTVTVTPATAELAALGATVQLTVEVQDQNGQVMAGAAVTWASGDASVATVDAAGLTAAAGNGTATITATAGTASGSSAVTVAQEVSAVTVSPVADTLVAYGDTVRLVAVAVDANGHAVAGAEFTWASSDTAVAAVDAVGLVTATGNGSATITAAVGDARGQSTIMVVANRAPAAVDSIPPHTMLLGDRASVDVSPFFSDPDGDPLTYAASSSDEHILAVSVSGSSVTVAALAPGTAAVTVTASDPSGLQATQNASVQGGILTAVRDIEAFLDQCPTNDSVFVEIRREFEVRFEGEPLSGPVVCSEPAAAMPSDEVTYQLKAYQTLRLAYHMNEATKGRLPWTEMGLYEWMVSRVSGVNMKQRPGLYYCCDLIDGKLYIATSQFGIDSSGQVYPFEQSMDWWGISITLPFYAHEIRHADEDDPGHVTGCEAFPLPSDPPGCDAAYDLGNLGGYGVHYWLGSSWATGYLNVGIACSPRVDEHITWEVESANLVRERFVTNVPPLLTADSFEGLCVPLKSAWK
ncbi:MAG: Ig-like domain-containing protein [Gammaproteobacteria bacterium]|nr:Ig-like domain-containing protein [Gammaproteobacteria bacterium]